MTHRADPIGYIAVMEKGTEVIAERYEVLDTLGQGAMGQVFKCHDRTLQREVAVKVLGARKSDEAAKRFHVEARAAAKLKHGNILQVLDFGQAANGDLYLVMELGGGQTLGELLEKEPLLPPETALPIFQQICNGIAHAHGQGVLHRDIKPSNVMLTETTDGEWSAKILDFGIAKLNSDDQQLTATGAIVGTPYYISPEAASNVKVDARSDVYSIGCLMFNTLTGSPPYVGENAITTILMHSDEPIPSLSSRGGGPFGPELEQVVVKCLAKKPQDRYQTIDELSAALDALETKLFEGSEEPQEASALKRNTDGSKSDKPKEGIASAKSVLYIWVGTVVALTLLTGAYLLANQSSLLNASSDDSSAQVKPTMERTEFTRMPADPIEKKLRLGDKKIYRVGDWMKASRETDDDQIAKQFEEIRGQKNFDFSQSLITKKGLELLARSKVEKLGLKRTLIDDDCMRVIGGIENLVSVDTSGCDKVTLDGLKYLKGNPKLAYLCISLPGEHEAALKALDSVAQLNQLVYLKTTGTIDGAMISKLRNLKNLKRLEIDSPSEDCWQALKKFGSRPSCHLVVYSFDGSHGQKLEQLHNFPKHEFKHMDPY